MAATFSSLFIDDQYLKDNTPVGSNIDPLAIYSFVENAQDVYIQDLLGTPLYMDLTYKLYMGVTYSTDERTLVDLCSKSLAYYALYLALPFLSINIRNAGVVESTSEHTQPVSLDKIRLLREEAKNMAEWFAERVIVYLCNNTALYPLYRSSSSKPDIYPSGGQYDSDIDLSPYGDYTEAERRFLDQYYRSR